MKNKTLIVISYIAAMVLLVLFNKFCNDYGVTTPHRMFLLLSASVSYELMKPAYAEVMSKFKKSSNKRKIVLMQKKLKKL